MRPSRTDVHVIAPGYLEDVAPHADDGVGTHKTLLAWLRARPQAEGCSNTLLHCPDRFHLDGSVARTVAEPHQARARKVLKKLMPAPAPLDS